MRCNLGNAFDNKAVIQKIVAIAAKRAALLGYPSHAAYVLEDETAKSPDAANEMLAKLAPAAVANARRELAEMQKLRSEEHTSELQQLMRTSYASFGLKKKKYTQGKNK